MRNPLYLIPLYSVFLQQIFVEKYFGLFRERNKAVSSYYNQHSIDVAAAKVGKITDSCRAFKMQYDRFHGWAKSQTVGGPLECNMTVSMGGQKS
jgi:hypothetical protein